MMAAGCGNVLKGCFLPGALVLALLCAQGGFGQAAPSHLTAGGAAWER